MNKKSEKQDKLIKKVAPKKVANLEVKNNNKKVKKNAENFTRAVGRRKTAVARVRLFSKGNGKIEVNGKRYQDFFKYFVLENKVVSPLQVIGKIEDFDFTIKVVGGGVLGQAEACRHGIARALVKFNEEDYRSILKAQGFLTRDPRAKERKKPGLKKARRAPQWSKR